MNEELSNAVNDNISSYIDDNVSVIKRIFGGTDDHADGEGNLSVTGSQVQPICYAIASNKKFVTKYGKGWLVNIDNAQGHLLYSYQDDKFLDKPELHLAAAIAEGQEEHDENATEITSAVINAIGNNSR